MSINQYCPDLTQPHRLSHPNQLYYAGRGALRGGIDLNNQDDDGCGTAEEIPKEQLFEKPLTPSDVGKLNRLVIPKQHAEKHFPLGGGGGGREAGENGLLLGFEDEAGKSWRFRYSYWNSSQSYVLTKGWSRFVKEKQLDAGDVVVFARHRVDAGRLFIGWRRRISGETGDAQPPATAASGWNRMLYSTQYTSPGQYVQSGPSSVAFEPESIHAGTSVVPRPTSSGNSKRLRLFGVNLDCHLEAAEDADPSTAEGSPMSGLDQAHQYHHRIPYPPPPPAPAPAPPQYYYSNHMDMSFSGSADVYRQG